MGLISGIEEAIKARVTETLETTVRTVESIPGGWSMDTLTRALQFSPGVYVAFLGAGPGANRGFFDGRFAVYTVSKGAIENDRRRGNARVIGAYDMVERLLPQLDGLDLAEIGQMNVTAVENLFRDALFDLGGTVYGITLALPNMPFELRADEAGLDDFLRVHADYDINQDDEVDATDDFSVR